MTDYVRILHEDGRDLATMHTETERGTILVAWDEYPNVMTRARAAEVIAWLFERTDGPLPTFRVVPHDRHTPPVNARGAAA